MHQSQSNSNELFPCNNLVCRRSKKSFLPTGDKKTVDRSKFLTQLKKILKIIVPKWSSPEIGFMGLISTLLAVRSLCDIWTIYLGTLIESAIIGGQSSRFNMHLLQFAMTMPTV